ncbi:hypothetical protein K2173_017059 [Erythroxylum novogranatense]|uniref:Uncharacterized protein n=1 Tax=Erythroxylum novogranatense TaxID=1862640 RepID=A0AAV8U5S3_9ROSI|nr:hypothetical protein K2173_017059 [Erythroxylum novogranatense]
MEEMKPAPEEVSNAFVNQYYNLLSHSPEQVHKFYQDTSVISRPGSDGLASSATTLDGIDKLILSLDYKDCGVEILTIDAQDSFGNGVIVLVTGYLTGKENIGRKFTQIFFLAPQGNGSFYVLNDVFRYVDAEDIPVPKSDETDDDTTLTAPATLDPESNVIPNHSVVDHATNSLEEGIEHLEESISPLENGKISDEKESVENSVGENLDASNLVPVGVDENDSDNHASTEAATSDVLEDAPKKSYASVANALNFTKQPFQQRVLPAKPVQRAPEPVLRALSPGPVSSNPVEKNNNHIVKGYSVFVANLPMDATEQQLREVLEKFGPIKSDGIQVRSYKQDKNCFGFVEFESADSMQSAVKAASIMIGNRRAHIEEKKANNDGGKYPARRGSFRNSGGRGYGRKDPENQGGILRPGWGPSGRNGETNHKVHQNGGRAPHQAAPQGQGVKN